MALAPRSIFAPVARSLGDALRAARDTVAGAGEQVVNVAATLHSFQAQNDSEPHPYEGDVFEPRGDAVQGARVANGLLQLIGLAPRAEDRAKAAAGRPVLAAHVFDTRVDAVRALSFSATAPGNDWGLGGRESSVVSVYVDGAYHSDVAVMQERPGRYEVNLGDVAAGHHWVELRAASDTSPREAGVPQVADLRVEQLRGLRAQVARHAPLLEGRDLGMPGGAAEAGWTDTPLVMVPRVTRNDDGSHTIDYRALFSNEDGGTYTHDLYRQWGRATDYETVYSVTLDAQGQRLAEHYQGPRHHWYDFDGERVGERPVLRVATANNNFSQNLRGSGTTWSPVPQVAGRDLRSFEVMLEHPWTFAVMAKELFRQRRAIEQPHAAGTVGVARIADPRDYLYLQGTRDEVRRAFDAGRGVSLLLRDGTTARATMPAGYAVPGEATALQLPAGVAADAIRGIAQLRGNVYLLGDDFLPRKVPTGLT